MPRLMTKPSSGREPLAYWNFMAPPRSKAVAASATGSGPESIIAARAFMGSSLPPAEPAWLGLVGFRCGRRNLGCAIAINGSHYGPKVYVLSIPDLICLVLSTKYP